MIVILLSVILFTVIGSFLIANVRMFNTTKDRIEAQGDLQNAIDSVTNYLVEIKGISNWSAANPDISGGQLKSVKLLNVDGTESILTYDAAAKKIVREDGPSSTLVMATNVTSFRIEPLNKALPAVSPLPSVSEVASSFEKCIGFRVEVTVTVEKYSLSASTDVYFRNNE